jgi:hypothetical protein
MALLEVELTVTTTIMRVAAVVAHAVARAAVELAK